MDIKPSRGRSVCLSRRPSWHRRRTGRTLSLWGRPWERSNHRNNSFTRVGWVDLSFVMSGFLIGAIVIANKDTDYLFFFRPSRSSRIFPRHYLLLAPRCAHMGPLDAAAGTEQSYLLRRISSEERNAPFASADMVVGGREILQFAFANARHSPYPLFGQQRHGL